MSLWKHLRWAVGALALTNCAWPQDLHQTVTYSTVAVPVKRALQEIGKLTNTSLDASVQLTNEIVVIDVKAVDLQELLDRIAKTTSGAFRKETGGVMRLYRPSEVARDEESKEVAARVLAIQKAVAKLNEPLKKTPVLDAKTADDLLRNQPANPLGGMVSGGLVGAARGAKALFTVGADQPAGRAVARLMALIDPRILARMDSGTRLVFSTRPNRVQLALPAAAANVLNLMVAEQQVWADAYLRKNGDQPKTDVSTVVNSMMGMAYGPIKGQPTKALLCVQRQAMIESYELRLKLYDAQGQEVFQGGQSMLLDASPLNRIDEMLKEKPSTGVEIELSQDSKELLAFMRGLTSMMFGGATSKALSDGMYGKLRRPDLYDPLSFIQSEALIAVSRSQSANLVADVPDAILSLGSFTLPGQKLTVEAFLKALGTGDAVTMESKDGWMVVRPTRPVLARAKRTDRISLAQLQAAAYSKGYVPLDDLAAYALKNPPLMESEVSQIYALFSLPGAATGITGLVNWDMLRFYGSLNSGQRQALGSGRIVEFRGLTTDQVELVRRMVYNPGMLGANVQVRGGNAQPVLGPLMASEPTEVLPDGIGLGGSVAVKITKDAVVKDAGANQPRIQLFGAFGPQELGAFKALREDPNMGSILGALLPDLAKFRLGSRSNYDFTFQLAPAISMNQSLQDIALDPNSPVMAYNDLPAEFRKQADAIQAQIKKAGGMPNIFGGGGGPVRP